MRSPRKKSNKKASGRVKTSQEQSSSPPPDPSESFLERKARRRVEAAERPRTKSAKDGQPPRFFRGNTSSGAFRPLMQSRGK